MVRVDVRVGFRARVRARARARARATTERRSPGEQGVRCESVRALLLLEPLAALLARLVRLGRQQRRRRHCLRRVLPRLDQLLRPVVVL